MLQYFLKRIFFLFIPTILLVSVLIFLLSYSQADPTHSICAKEFGSLCNEVHKKRIRKELRMDWPVFYFSINSQVYPDTFHRIVEETEQEPLDRLLNQYGNWDEISAYHAALKSYQVILDRPKQDTSNHYVISNLGSKVRRLTLQTKDSEILHTLKYSKLLCKDSSQQFLLAGLNNITRLYENIKTTQTPHKNYIPAFRWHGSKNQYHRWLVNFIHLDFGKSYLSRLPVKTEIREHTYWTIILSAISIILAYLIALPLGVIAAIKKGSRTDKLINIILFALFSLPNFWLATMLIIFGLAPAGGLPPFSSELTGFWEKFFSQLQHLLLPIFCWTYPALAFLSRQMRGSMLQVLQQDFVKTARAKGLSNNVIIRKHVFRNALIPIITMFGGVLPRLFAGSIILEIIFGIPGMGKYLFEAVNSHDFPVLFAIVMLLSILTVVGYLISDILYAISDPRIKFKK